jgi:hypothetical protein
MDLDPEEAKEMAQMQQRLKGLQNTDWSEKYVPTRSPSPPKPAHHFNSVAWCRLVGALAGKAAGVQDAAGGDVQAIKAPGAQGGAARRRKGR